MHDVILLEAGTIVALMVKMVVTMAKLVRLCNTDPYSRMIIAN